MSAARRAPDRPGQDGRGRRDRPERGQPNLAARIGLGVGGGILVLVGLALLVLPGPGLLLVLAGLVLLARALPAVARFEEPVRIKAMEGVEASVASPLRIAGSALAGVALLAAGLILGLNPWSWLPFAGWSTGGSIMLSGVILLGLLVWSYRRVRGGDRVRGRQGGAGGDANRRGGPGP